MFDIETIFCHEMIDKKFNIDDCILQKSDKEHDKWLKYIDEVVNDLKINKDFYVSNILVLNNFTQTDIDDLKFKLLHEELRILKRIKFIREVESVHNNDEINDDR